jgi:hypothetical protein
VKEWGVEEGEQGVVRTSSGEMLYQGGWMEEIFVSCLSLRIQDLNAGS